MLKVRVSRSGRCAVHRLAAAFAMAIVHSGTGYALDADQQHAKSLLVEMCARCHAVGNVGRSPHPEAPPFRTLGERKLYDEDFGRRLRDGLSTMHPDMPTFHFSQREAEAVVSYLRAIQVSREP